MPPAHVEGIDPALIADATVRDSVRALYAQSPQGLVIALVIGAMFVYVFQRYAGAWATWGWAAALAATQLLGAHYWLAFRRIQHRGDWQPGPWQRSFTLRCLVSGLVFGATTWLFFDAAYGDARWLAILSVCALGAGSITAFAYHKPAMWAFLFGLALPTALALEQFDFWIATAVFLFYMGMLAWFGHNQSRILLESIARRHENALLVERLRVQAQQLEAALQAKSQFFAAASHDLRQPLHALGHYAALLRPSAHDQPYVERVQQCIDALDGLLEGVLDISRLDAGRVPVQPGPVPLDRLLRRLAALYEGAAQTKGLRLRLRLPRAPAWGHSDAALLERVLANLLSNAVRYTERGGILLALRRRHAAGSWQVMVVDTGVGIAPADLERVFDEFVQLGNPERDATRGVGLGLATVRRLCALLGHPLKKRSRPGHGSCFAVELPALADAANPRPDAPHAEPPPADEDGGVRLRGRVLVVDDHELVRTALVDHLRRWGLEADAVGEADAALERARACHYDAVLCDWRLPGALDGLQLIERLRALQPRLALALLITGEAALPVASLPRGVTLLGKPVKPIRLRSLLAAALPQQERA